MISCATDPDLVQILVKTKEQADRAWQLLINQWEIDQAQVWIAGRPAYQFRRENNGEPALLRPKKVSWLTSIRSVNQASTILAATCAVAAIFASGSLVIFSQQVSANTTMISQIAGKINAVKPCHLSHQD